MHSSSFVPQFVAGRMVTMLGDDVRDGLLTEVRMADTGTVFWGDNLSVVAGLSR